MNEIWEHGEYILIFFRINLNDLTDIRLCLFQRPRALVVLLVSNLTYGVYVGYEECVVVGEVFMKDFHERVHIILEEFRDILTVQVDV